MDDQFADACNGVIRSLISAAEFSVYEETGVFNTGDGHLNTAITTLSEKGELTAAQHRRLQKRLTSGTLNDHLDDLSYAKRYGSLVCLQGGFW